MPHRAAKCLAEEKHSLSTGRPCVWFTCNPLKTARTRDTLNTNHSVLCSVGKMSSSTLRYHWWHLHTGSVSHPLPVGWLLQSDMVVIHLVMYFGKTPTWNSWMCWQSVHRCSYVYTWLDIRSSHAEIKPWWVSCAFTHLRNFDYKRIKNYIYIASVY